MPKQPHVFLLHISRIVPREWEFGIIGFRGPVPDPIFQAQHVVSNGHLVAGRRLVSDQSADLTTRRRVQPLVRIQHQHPIALHRLQRLVSRRREVVCPRNLNHLRVVLPGDCYRFVCRAGVRDHNFIHDSPHALQASRQRRRCVPHNHRKCHGRHICPWCSSCRRPCCNPCCSFCCIAIAPSRGTASRAATMNSTAS